MQPPLSVRDYFALAEHLLYAGNSLSTCSCLTNPQNHSYWLHSAEEETKALRGAVPCLVFPPGKCWSRLIEAAGGCCRHASLDSLQSSLGAWRGPVNTPTPIAEGTRSLGAGEAEAPRGENS